MADLFAPFEIGNLRLRNRFVHSATFEGMATENGEVTTELVKRYEKLARGEVGLIIPGYMYVRPEGRAELRIAAAGDTQARIQQILDTLPQAA